MTDQELMRVTYIVDDSTGDYEPGDTDYSIKSIVLTDYLRRHGQAGADDIKRRLDDLKDKVDEYLREVERT